MKQTVINIFSSLSMAIPLMAIYAILIGFATFIENDYGTQAAKTLIYNTWFFNILHLWIAVCLIGMIIKNKLFERKRYSSFILHIALVVIIIGAGITRFYGKEGILNLREGEVASSYKSLENYFNFTIIKDTNQYNISIPTDINYISSKMINKVVIFGENSLKFKTTKVKKLSSDKRNNIQELNAIIEYNDKQYEIILIGGEGVGEDTKINMDDITLNVNWGAKIIDLPFSITLNDFILERYPGSMSPSSYESEVTLEDKVNNIKRDYNIYMNNTLDYKGYRFFQASYDEDEQGSILSVNKDPGKYPTYMGYLLLIIGAIGIILIKMVDLKN